ncbi:MAG TPA: alpha/beta hydrolase [Anaeromyxobacteraceae bacterium]|nr:alpha/beta hydrolase [Anaeromyxobacteraceae bacterium]
MAPRIRFLRARAGHRLAYATDGSGPALVLPAWWVSHVERDLADPGFRRFFTRLAERFTVVRYDRLGTGLSDRERSDFTLEQEVADLDAVVGELAVDRCTLLGVSCGGPTAIEYAARHPERVERLALFGSYAHGEALGRPELRAALVALVRASWGVGAKTLSDIFTPEATAEEARHFASEQVHAASAEMAARLLQLVYEMDVRGAVERVAAPALVMHRRGDRAVRFDQGRELAARLRGATFVPLEGLSHPPWQGDGDPALSALFAFCQGEATATTAAGAAPASHPELRRDGDVWTVRYADRTAHVKHARGLADLATLVARPGHAFAALELMGGGAAEAQLGADPALDERARVEYRERLDEIDRSLADALAADLPARAAALEAERDAILHELRAATGLGGRPRALGDARERARKAVSSRIREAIDRLREAHPELGRHLEAAVATGTHCSYDPGRRGGGEPAPR